MPLAIKYSQIQSTSSTLVRRFGLSDGGRNLLWSEITRLHELREKP
jgi:hypothetical protein